MVKAIIFDFWGTLVANGSYSPTKQSKRILRQFNMDFGEFVVRFEKAAFTKNFKDQKEAFTAACDEFDVPCGDKLLDTLIGVWNKNKLLAKPYPDVLETIVGLKQKGVKLAILSNTPVESASSVLEKFDLAKYFDFIALSCEIGMLKTDPKAFDIVFEKLGVTKEDCIMVGDSIESDMNGAKNAGVKGILVDRRDTREYDPKIVNFTELLKL